MSKITIEIDTEKPEATSVQKSNETTTKSAVSSDANSFDIVKTYETEDYTYVLGPVLIPEVVDQQGDIISAEEIAKTAHDFMQDSQTAGLLHKVMLGTRDAAVVESYVAPCDMMMKNREGDDVMITKGTWMMGTRVYNEEIRDLIKSGKLTGYSIGGKGQGEEEEMEVAA